MSNRIRMLLESPEVGSISGGHRIATFVDKYFAPHKKRTVFPEEFATWPKWKRLLFKVQTIGNGWTLKVYREKRRTSAYKSMYWRKLVMATGSSIPVRPRRKRAAAQQLAEHARRAERERIRINRLRRPGGQIGGINRGIDALYADVLADPMWAADGYVFVNPEPNGNVAPVDPIRGRRDR